MAWRAPTCSPPSGCCVGRALASEMPLPSAAEKRASDTSPTSCSTRLSSARASVSVDADDAFDAAAP
eukprot:996634-Prymnesium_polylepis.1